uniref:Chorion early B n=1 Tax=Bombyx mori TaxID=7091 RepID=A0A8R2R3V9_BOMMO|nr:chorion class B protein ERB4-like isoform X2 [Bombyx mori]
MSALSQCSGRGWYEGLGGEGPGFSSWYNRYGNRVLVDLATNSALGASNGGSFAVTSVSPCAPTGIALSSQNIYEGPVGVAGNLPFLGTAAVEETFKSIGVGHISSQCGDGVVAIRAESPVSAITPSPVPAVRGVVNGLLGQGTECGCASY